MLKYYTTIKLHILSYLFAFLFINSSNVNAQSNQWEVHPDATIGSRSHFAINYISSMDKFILNLGSYSQNNNHPYPDLIYDDKNKKWFNYLPDSLYGIWADSTGNTLTPGIFNGFYFEFKEIEGHNIPQLIHSSQARVYNHYALNTKNNKIYYYVNGITFSYDPQTKEYEIYKVSTHPSLVDGNTGVLKWGMMCYDAINDEILLLGGAGIDAKDGHPGFWSFRMKDNQWHHNTNTIIPEPRAYSNMVYDDVQQKILLFGGDHLDYLFSDTWEYDCKTRIWKKLSPTNSPSPRGGHLMRYSKKSKKIFLLGGYEYALGQGIDYLSALYNPLKQLDLWTYDWNHDTWNFIKAFDYKNNAPKAQTSKPNIVTGDIDLNDRLLVVADGTSKWTYEPRTYEIVLDLDEIDSIGTLNNSVAQGTIQRRDGPYDPSYFKNNNEDLNVDFYDNLPVDTWVKVPVGNNLYPENNRDWGTTVYDPDRNLFYKWSGGHSAHCGTDVPIYNPIKSHWELEYFGDFPLEYVYANSPSPGFYSFNNRPFMKGHTYSCYDYDINLKKMISIGNRYTYIFDPDKKDWLDTKVDNPKGIRFNIYYLSVNSTNHGAVLWTSDLSNTSISFLFQFDSHKMGWEKIEYEGPRLKSSYCDFAGAVYDNFRDRLIFATFNRKNKTTSLMTYDFKSNKTVLLEPKNAHLAQNSELYREGVYIPSLDIILYQIQIDDDHKLIYNCTTNSWESLSIRKSNGIKSTDTRSSGYMYDAKRNIIYDCETNCEVYALRLSGSYPTDTITNLENTHEEFSHKISIFPIPAIDHFNVSFPYEMEYVELSLLDMNGFNYFRNEYNDVLFVDINTDNIPNGSYILNIKTDKGTHIKKIEIIKP